MQRFGLAGGLGIAPLAAVCQGTQGFGQLKQCGQGRRGVEVVVHGSGEAQARLRQGIRRAVGPIACGTCHQLGGQLQGSVEALPTRGRGSQGLLGEIERLAIVGLEHEEAQGHRRSTALKQGADRGEVAQGFGHLFAAHIDHAVVQPPAGQGLARGRFRLGDFVVVVGEDQIGAAEMEINRVSQLLAHHGRAFDMPTRPAGAPGGRETGLPRFGPFPKGEIKGMLLAGFLKAGDPTIGVLLLLREIAAREFAVASVFHHGEIDIAIGAIGRPLGLQFANQGADRIEALGGPGHAIGRQDVEGGHIGHKGVNVALTHHLHGAAFLGSPVEDLVVDVGVILHERHLVAAPEQVAAQHIPGDVTAGVA